MRMNYVCHPCARRLLSAHTNAPLLRMAVRPDQVERAGCTCRLCCNKIFPSHGSVYAVKDADMPRLKELENSLPPDEAAIYECRCRTCTTLRTCDCVYCQRMCDADADACSTYG